MLKNHLKRQCGLVLKEGEKLELLKLCLKHKIPVDNLDIFFNENNYYLWCISYKGVGLISTFVIKSMEQKGDTIFTSLEDLKIYLEG